MREVDEGEEEGVYIFHIAKQATWDVWVSSHHFLDDPIPFS